VTHHGDQHVDQKQRHEDHVDDEDDLKEQQQKGQGERKVK